MKGLLHGLGRGPWGHDLVRLGELGDGAGIALPTDIEAALRRLGRHYIPARYPDAHALGPPGAHYGDSDADEALADAERLLDFVDRVWDKLDA